MNKPANLTYDEQFFTVQTCQSSSSAAVVVPLVNELVQPRSVLDVGCGIGAWLAEWQRQGVTDICGLDGPHVDRRQLQIDDSHFVSTDLENLFDLGRRFDLAQCLEVAEHLDRSAADSLVRCIAAHADTVLFGAAIPKQGGAHHVNEQWQSYWVEKFVAKGFHAFDVIRPRIWDDDRVMVWYRQNTLLLARDRDFGPAPVLADVVHPVYWTARQVPPSLRQCLRRLPAAAREALDRRLGH